MEINAHDLIVFHKNVKRTVGQEIYWNNTLAYNDSEIMHSIEKLINNKLLIKTNQFELSIHKLTNNDLKQVLKSNNLRTTGNKSQLIDRINQNYSTIQGLALPYIYVATEEGEKTLKDTSYLLSFDIETGVYSISIDRAYYLAKKYISQDCDDKVAEIYKFEFNRKYDNNSLNSSYYFEIDQLISHYKKHKKDFEHARKYTNIYLYLTIRDLLYNLQNANYLFYEDDGELDLNRLQTKLDFYHESIYERMLLIDRLSNEHIYKLFKEDTSEFDDLDDELSRKYINYIISLAKKEDEVSEFNTLVEILKSDYALDKEEFEDEYEYYYESNIITTHIETLSELKSNIVVEVDTRSGKINFALDDAGIDKLTNINNQNQ
ncbi:SAP domain-containing protein [Staphylococcus shinii]|uniref:SAP domain-containing protein n=1 Tax=Staphylococcus shinii TaxID=2912228 RepID=UPI003EEB7F36